MTAQQLERGVSLDHVMKDIQHAISAIETTKDHHGVTISACFLRPVVKDAILSVLKQNLADFKQQFEQL